MVCWAAMALILVASAGAQDDEARLREPVCGHHADPRGFSLDLPQGVCGQRYEHGLSILLSKKDAPVVRSIVVWAARNANFDARSSDIAAAEVSATASDTLVGVRVTRRANTRVAGVPGVRWHYTFHSKADAVDREAELVAVLRPLRPHPEWQDYYEYSMVLRSTPQEFGSDLKVFEQVLGTFAFGEPEM
ncbi:MAG TPA: hypothetical protein VMX54_11870 [Vicinamibacteria bacterium]|nr:hypothetical protein [Vicinamibacteria bacterium]